MDVKELEDHYRKAVARKRALKAQLETLRKEGEHVSEQLNVTRRLCVDLRHKLEAELLARGDQT